MDRSDSVDTTRNAKKSCRLWHWNRDKSFIELFNRNFKKYIKHPILKFYNKGLVADSKKLAECEQLNVSINTDDQGVFNTSLENEYAYMALALEKAKDKDGKYLYKKSVIYQWLDDIRKMGIRQTFLSESEMTDILKK